MSRTHKSMSILIIATLALILTSCGGSEKTVYKDRPVTSIVYRDASTTVTSSAPRDSFAPSEIIWKSFCSEADKFCADFPEVPGAQGYTGVFEASENPATADYGAFNAYDVDLERSYQTVNVLFCNNLHSKDCQQDDTSHGVSSDTYGVYVGIDEDPSLDFDDYDNAYGDCGGRPDREVTPIKIGSYDAAKITCRYSYALASFRTLYFMRRDGKTYEINASNQTARPYFDERFLASFRPTP